MTDKLKTLLVNKANELGWFVTIDECYWEFEQDSPAGEDFLFDIHGEDVVKELYDYYEGFDPNEHAKMWIEAQGTIPGVPNSIRLLIDDADAIDEMLSELVDALHDVEKEYYDKEVEDSD